MTWEDFKRTLATGNSLQESVLSDLARKIKKYRQDIQCFNYPSRLFYICAPLYWLTDQVKEVYGIGIPFLFGLAQGSKGHWIWVLHRGLGDNILQQVEQERCEYIKTSREKAHDAYNDFDDWLKKQVIEQDKPLQYYLDKIDETCRMLLEVNICFQPAVHVDELLDRKLLALFRGIDKGRIAKMCVAEEKADVIFHRDMLAELVEWCRGKGYALTRSGFSSLMKDEDFKQRLEQCYEQGYFLHSSYGGVTFWNLEKEYALLAEMAEYLPKEGGDTEVLQDMPLTEEQEFWIKAAKHFSLLRDRRKSVQQKSFYHQALLLQEVSRICGIPLSDLECLRVDQMTVDSLKDKAKIHKLVEAQRTGFFFCWTEDTSFFVETGEGAIKLFQRFDTSEESPLQEIQGQSACGGSAQGIVRVILSTHEDYEFNKGDVLVTGMTSPDFVPLMRKASAIITDLGGVTCHAAIIAREMDKPCLISTKIATKVLRDGDLVDVDADKGIVRVVKKNSPA